MGSRADAGKDVGDDPVFIHQVGDATGKAPCTGAIDFAQHMLGIAQQRKLKAGLCCKSLVRRNPVKARTKNLHVVCHKGVIVVTEPVPFRRSAAGAGFGIKP